MKTMFRILILSIAALAIASCAPPANTNSTTNSNANANTAAKPAGPTADTLMALDQKAWEAYQKKDGKYFEGFLGDTVISGTGQGTMTKADVVKMIAENKSDVKSFTLSEARVTPVGADTAVLTYKAVVDGTEDGKKIPSPSTVATVFVRSGSDWKAVYHEEVAIVEPPKADDANKNAAPAAKADEKKEAPAAAEEKKAPVPPPAANSNSGAASNSNTASSTGDAALTDALMVMEKKGWEGWKAKDAKALDEVTTGGSNFVFIDLMGKATMGKDAAIKGWTTDNPCTVSSISLSDGKGYSIAKDAAILVYKGSAEGTCGGMKIEPLWGTTVAVKEGETWKAAYILEQPVKK